MRRGLLLVVGVSCGVVGVAQSAPKFEVVSIKPSTVTRGPGFESIGAHFQPGGRFVGTNVTALSLIGLGSALVRSMLEDRFKFRAHLEPRDLPAFALKVAKANGTLGPNIHPSADCEALMRERVARGDTPFLSTSGPPARGERRCGAMSSMPGRGAGAMNRMTGTGVQLSLAAGVALRPAVSAPIVDQTGLTGLYDFELSWADDNSGRGGAASLPDGASIFTALQEQLGLKLEPTRVARRVIVVDHIEPPTPD